MKKEYHQPCRVQYFNAYAKQKTARISCKSLKTGTAKGVKKLDKNTVITEKKIGTTTYTIVASPSENAKETLKTKVEKLIIKNLSAVKN